MTIQLLLHIRTHLGLKGKIPYFYEQYFIMKEQVYKRKEHIGLFKNLLLKGKSLRQNGTWT